MERLFIVIAVLTFHMTAITGAGVYYFSQASINEAKNEAFRGLAEGAAQSISTRATLLAQTLQNIALSPELITALQQSDLARARMLVQQMGVYLPGAVAFRLLLPSDTEPDISAVPHLGYADIDMVKNTFQKAQLPLVHGEKGKNRHLAITQGIVQDGKVIAVILASVRMKELKYSFNKLMNERIYLELKQAKFVLFSYGNSALKAPKNYTSVKVKGTAWSISYWSDDSIDFSLINLVISIILIPAFISGLTCYICYKKLETILIEDERSALKATKDIMMGKTQGNYPITLKEMSNFVANITQFKRTLDSGGITRDKASILDDSDLDAFFEESEHSNFLSSEFTTYKEKKSEIPHLGAAISLPEFGDDDIDVEDIGVEVEFPQNSSASLSNELTPGNAIFRAYDIRGIVDKTLTKKIVYAIGRAVGSEAVDKGLSTIVIAKDGRTSSPNLSKELADGILSTGTNILDIGTVPTPVLYFVAHHHEAHSGIMLTGSHNPAEYNGLKIVLDNETLAGEKIQALKKRIDNNDFHSNKAGTLTENSMFTNEYIGVISDDIRIARPMKVVVDAGNGVAGELGPILLKTLGCEVIELFCDIDGTFPNHHPDPSKPENLLDLISAVKKNQADLGIAFDGDGDRLGVVDSNGKIIWPDRQMMLFSQHILAKKPGADIIYDVKCSQQLASQIKKNRGNPIIWKTGHSLMKAKIKQTAAIFAGEMSGHLYFNDRWFGFDDGLYSAARLIEILSEDTRTSADVFADFPDSPNTPELNINLAEGESSTIMQQLLSNPDFPDGKITNIDGLRVDFDDGFGLVRASNTTPSLVVRFEGDTEDALKRIQDQFRKLILQIKPNLSLPF
ncbi:MAG: phosphomannomutase/phosphoglucomutase [Methyloprofundus sp.]|nr:phosphomannomutase/phosphoglucomutase [Methyloprofundus sp.]